MPQHVTFHNHRQNVYKTISIHHNKDSFKANIATLQLIQIRFIYAVYIKILIKTHLVQHKPKLQTSCI